MLLGPWPALWPAPEILRESLYGDGLTEVRIPVLTRVGTWPAGEHGPQGEMPGEHKRPFVLHFTETPKGLKWLWFCRGERDGRPCGATPTKYAAYFEDWIDALALQRWPGGMSQWQAEGSQPLVVEVG